jgi:hypothetical protein
MEKTNHAPQTCTNAQVADSLERVADLLEAQEANPFRVRAYRQAATTVREHKEPVAEILAREGVAGLQALPTIGESLSRSIEQLIDTGKINLLERLQGETSIERVLATVPGVGPVLAGRIHEQLGIETLVELELAAADGRLQHVPGFGANRVRAVRESLAGRFRRPAATPARPARAPTNGASTQPAVAELLDVDREYREKAKAKTLPKIAPRRFNPTGEAWLPVLHTERDKVHYTALYSNTARAHELGTTSDWVVIYRDDDAGDGQWTVVTARYGALLGKRVVRGREEECARYYEKA